MKIKATKVMAKYLNKELPDYHVELIELGDDSYQALVGESVYDAEYHGDFNYNTRATKVLKISYPDEYYALPRYISTKELGEIFKGITTESEFKAEIKNALTI